MEPNYGYSKPELVEELELDSTIAESSSEKRLTLIRVNENRQSEADDDLYSGKRLDADKWEGLSDKDGEEHSEDLSSGR